MKQKKNGTSVKIPKITGDKTIDKKIDDLIFECLRFIPKENEFSYVTRKIQNASPHLDKSNAGYQAIPALKQMIEKRVSKNAIMDVIRCAMADAMFFTFRALEGDYGAFDAPWGVYIEDRDGKPIRKMFDCDLSCNFEEPEFIPRNVKKKLDIKPSTNPRLHKYNADNDEVE